MLDYLKTNHILSLSLIVNNLTAYVLLSLMDQLIIPSNGKFIMKRHINIDFPVLFVKVLMWLLLLNYCRYMKYRLS